MSRRYGSNMNGKKQALLQQNSKQRRQLATKSRKLQLARGVIGGVKAPENPVAILIGNSCVDKDGNNNIYGDRDMLNLKRKLEKWCPRLKPDDDEEDDDEENNERILLLTNKPHMTVVQRILKFVDSEIFKQADFIFFGCSTHGAEHTTHFNRTGRHCNAISDSNGTMMLFEGSKSKPGIVDLIEYYSGENALRLYLYGACRTPFDKLKLGIPECIDFAEDRSKDYVQKGTRGGCFFAKPCNFKKSAYAAQPGEKFSPWLNVIVNLFDSNPGRKIVDVFRDAEKELHDKSKKNPRQEQRPSAIFTSGFKYGTGDAVFQDTLNQSDGGGRGNSNYLNTSNNIAFDNNLTGLTNNNFSMINEGVSSSSSSSSLSTSFMSLQQSPGSISSSSSIMSRRIMTKKQKPARNKKKRKRQQESLVGSEDVGSSLQIILGRKKSNKTDDRQKCFICKRMVAKSEYFPHFINCNQNQTNEQTSSETSALSNNNNASNDASNNKIESRELLLL